MIVTSSETVSETVTVQIPLAFVMHVLPLPNVAEPSSVNWTVAFCAPTPTLRDGRGDRRRSDAAWTIGGVSVRPTTAGEPATYWLKCGSAAVIVWCTVSTVEGSGRAR